MIRYKDSQLNILSPRKNDWAADVKENLKLFLEYINLERKYYGDSVDLPKIKEIDYNF